MTPNAKLWYCSLECYWRPLKDCLNFAWRPFLVLGILRYLNQWRIKVFKSVLLHWLETFFKSILWQTERQTDKAINCLVPLPRNSQNNILSLWLCQSQMREREVKGHEDKASLTVNSGRYEIMWGKNPIPLPLTMDRTLCPKIFPFPNYFDSNAKINLSR